MKKQNQFDINNTKNIIGNISNTESFNFNVNKIFQKTKEKNNKNEYYCNLLISITNQPLTKIEYYKLLFSINNLNYNKNYKYYLYIK